MKDADAFDRVVEHERRHHAGRRGRRARRSLRVHAWIYLAVNLGLVAAWLTELAVFDDRHPAWWLPTTVGWGVGLLVHALVVRRPAGGRSAPAAGTFGTGRTAPRRGG
jgi:peptidoglycan/LPS O-acetylase OafA/YrhL